jgi:hypothetical protein
LWKSLAAPSAMDPSRKQITHALLYCKYDQTDTAREVVVPLMSTQECDEDWLDANICEDELRALIEASPLPGEGPPPHSVPASFDEILAASIEMNLSVGDAIRHGVDADLALCRQTHAWAVVMKSLTKAIMLVDPHQSMDEPGLWIAILEDFGEDINATWFHGITMEQWFRARSIARRCSHD